MSARPVVYLGPSARPEAVLRHLPDAVLRPPIKRGDLHRDRLLRFSVFVVIDGVFAQEEALSPREVVDVIADGGRFVGAASMGALRAADCAPAGALGVGAVYRLFRRRVISSEDEVAVTFLPGVGAVTLSLVSIRWALHRGWRRGALSRARAEALFAAAQALPYTERTWQRICAAAPDGPRFEGVGPDIKAQDAARAAAQVARWCAQDPGWAERPRQGPLRTTGAQREAARQDIAPKDREALARWLWITGRAGRYVRQDVTSVTSLTAAAAQTYSNSYAAGPEGPDRLADALEAVGALEKEYPRWIALLAAGQSDVVPERVDTVAAEAQLAAWHGLSGWAEVAARLHDAMPELTEARRQMACGKALRRELDEEGRSHDGI